MDEKCPEDMKSDSPLQPYDAWKQEMKKWTMHMLLIPVAEEHRNAQELFAYGFVIRGMDTGCEPISPLCYDHLGVAGDFVCSQAPYGSRVDANGVC